ncbi:hypothetical protein T10_8985 [Trichinella papuae]|uniref:Uncharacterized protein n=1 Tax=Trichinella papuae TaxID=268474 RepID=A0A0V1MR02_9BILA|nr:hypothetical protein T10_8985 [Trichinella papuae]
MKAAKASVLVLYDQCKFSSTWRHAASSWINGPPYMIFNCLHYVGVRDINNEEKKIVQMGTTQSRTQTVRSRRNEERKSLRLPVDRNSVSLGERVKLYLCSLIKVTTNLHG